MERLCVEMIEFYRNLMILKSVRNPEELIVASPSEMQEMQQEASGLELGAILHLMDVLQTTLDRLKGGVSRRVEMETTLLRLCEPRLDTTPESLLRRIEDLEAGLVRAQPMPAAQPTATEPTPTEADPAQPVAPKAVVQAETTNSGEMTPFDRWPEVLARLSEQCPPLYGVLMDSVAMTDGEKLVVITDNDLFVTLVKTDGNKFILMNAVQAIAGKPMRISRGRPVKDEKTVPQAAAPQDPLSAFLKQSADAGVTIEVKG
jgi:DNA polymerase-3 subunit gamma/tau